MTTSRESLERSARPAEAEEILRIACNSGCEEIYRCGTSLRSVECDDSSAKQEVRKERGVLVYRRGELYEQPAGYNVTRDGRYQFECPHPHCRRTNVFTREDVERRATHAKKKEVYGPTATGLRCGKCQRCYFVPGSPGLVPHQLVKAAAGARTISPQDVWKWMALGFGLAVLLAGLAGWNPFLAGASWDESPAGESAATVARVAVVAAGLSLLLLSGVLFRRARPPASATPDDHSLAARNILRQVSWLCAVDDLVESDRGTPSGGMTRGKEDSKAWLLRAAKDLVAVCDHPAARLLLQELVRLRDPHGTPPDQRAAVEQLLESLPGDGSQASALRRP